MPTLQTIARISGLVVLLLLSQVIWAKEDWRAIDPSYLKITAPAVEKDADAEALLWEIRVDKDIDKAVVTHYVLIKIFNDRGRESQSTIEILYYDKLKIKDVMARTIKPNGQIVIVNPSDMFDKQVLRARKFKVNVISFAMPGVEPGALIEYSWKEEYKSADFVRVDLQRDVPVQMLKLALKGKNSWGTDQRIQYFNLPDLTFLRDDKGYMTTSLQKIRAFREEPMMPTADAVRPWMLLYTQYPDSASLWEQWGRLKYQEIAGKTKLNDELRQKATELVRNATSNDEKLARIYEFCRTGIRNLSDPNLSDAERRAVKENKNAADTLRNRIGTGRDINTLFIALANAAGFDARVAMLADRSRYAFDKTFTGTYYMALLLDSHNVAIKVDGQWRFFDPASTYIAYGMLRWQEEGQDALIADPFQPLFVVTPFSSPEKTLIQRTGKLQLCEDGALEGDVQVAYTGHLAVENRLNDLSLTERKREEEVVKSIKTRLPNAEISQFKVENLTDATKPLVYTYHVRVPNYAQRAGKRMLFNPSYFQAGKTALFATSARQYSVLFGFAWAEKDEVTITLPKDFQLEAVPENNAIRTTNNGQQVIGRYEVEFVRLDSQNALQYKRKFYFGDYATVLFPASTYSSLKAIFDMYQQRDSQQISLISTAVLANK